MFICPYCESIKTGDELSCCGESRVHFIEHEEMEEPSPDEKFQAWLKRGKEWATAMMVVFALLVLSGCGREGEAHETCPLIVKPDHTWECAK